MAAFLGLVLHKIRDISYGIINSEKYTVYIIFVINKPAMLKGISTHM